MAGVVACLPPGRAAEPKRTIQAGDLVIVYESFSSSKAITVDPSAKLDNKFGVFHHKDWIGLPFGSRVAARPTGRASNQQSGWVHLLAPTPELWTLVLKHRTQILYVADISLVTFNLELKPGSVVLETGTGSGSLTHSLVRAVAPTGHVHTFEFHAQRAAEAAAEFAAHGLSSCVDVVCRNIEELGFPSELEGKADAVFLDLPGPWKVVPSAARCLRVDGRFCSFSPCIEQVQRTAEALEANDFVDITTVECLLRNYEVRQEQLITSSDLMPTVRPAKRPRPTQEPHSKCQQPATGDNQPSTAQAEQVQGQGQGETPDPAAAVPAVGVSGAAPNELSEAMDTAVEAVEECAPIGVGDNVRSAQPEADQLPDSAAADVDGVGQAVSKTSKEADAKPDGQGVKGRRQGGDREQQTAKGGRGGRGKPAANSLKQQSVSVVCARPSMDARGHTGYLTFARKFAAV